jgi:hypothetical protein
MLEIERLQRTAEQLREVADTARRKLRESEKARAEHDKAKERAAKNERALKGEIEARDKHVRDLEMKLRETGRRLEQATKREEHLRKSRFG